jgi:hypothetical protein
MPFAGLSVFRSKENNSSWKNKKQTSMVSGNRASCPLRLRL